LRSPARNGRRAGRFIAVLPCVVRRHIVSMRGGGARKIAWQKNSEAPEVPAPRRKLVLSDCQ
jgi:hypothetical protein